jgi:hypothetical protein
MLENLSLLGQATTLIDGEEGASTHRSAASPAT